ncbi:MAG: hypothetical protein BWK76_23670 [Desulfobulbaceae bacterium A2]|nr:MAG: hypothetical protein BWK76_23670 [Desulfobulbaceae bacterium A2]
MPEEQGGRVGGGGRNLKLRFQVGLLVILLCFCALAAALIYFAQRTLLTRESLRKTELVMASVDAVRGYAREVLRPRMYEALQDESFVLEAMSTSYITRVVMDRFREKVPAFAYRRVSEGARNPDYEANELEREMINFFRQHPERQDWSGTVRREDGQYFMRFRPVVFDESCLHCHGRPEDAPVDIVERYGESPGFFRQVGTIGGVQSIAISVDASLAEIRETAFFVFGIALLGVCFLYLFIWVLFSQVVVANFRDVLKLFRGVLSDDTGTRLYEHARNKDEFSELFASAGLMVEHLRESRHQLEVHAEHLEEKVAERTEALALSQERLRVQVRARNQELHLLNTIAELMTRADELPEILERILSETLRTVPAMGGGMYLVRQSSGRLELQCQHQAAGLPSVLPLPTQTDPATCVTRDPSALWSECGQLKLHDSETQDRLDLVVPLCCRNQLRGLMVFVGLEMGEIDELLRDLVLSIGRQAGITIESLQNIADLRQHKDLLQSVFDGISDPVVQFDAGGCIRMVNHAFVQLVADGGDEVVSRSLDSLPPEQAVLFGRIRAARSPLPVQPAMELVSMEGGRIFEVSSYPILGTGGEVVSMVCFARDVTERERMAQHNQKTEKLVAIGQLAAGVAHEINNPLGVILCYADIIKNEADRTEQVREDIAVIERQANACRRIVGDLLSFARGSRQTVQRSGNVNELVERVLGMVGQQFSKQHILLHVELAADLPAILMDGDRLQQVVLNLVMNAAQAIGSDGNIRISTTRAAEGGVCLSVEDDGPGITMELLPKIFEPFFTTKAGGEGTGLGLSVSYGIVRDHDGEIHVESEPGRGARFIVHLPVLQEG